jgi:hypothetical protein
VHSSPRRIALSIPHVDAQTNGTQLGTDLCERRIELALTIGRRGNVQISSAFGEDRRQTLARFHDALEENDIARTQQNPPDDHPFANSRGNRPLSGHFAHRTPALVATHPLKPAALHEYERVLPA